MTIVLFANVTNARWGLPVHAFLVTLMERLPGQLRVVWKGIGGLGSNAVEKNRAALAAHQQGKFWEYAKLIQENSYSTMLSDLKKYAKKTGLDVKAWKKAYSQLKRKKVVERDNELLKRLDESYPPRVFVNGRKFRGFLLRMDDKLKEQLEELVREELGKARRLVAEGCPPAEVYTRSIGKGRVRSR